MYSTEFGKRGQNLFVFARVRTRGHHDRPRAGAKARAQFSRAATQRRIQFQVELYAAGDMQPGGIQPECHQAFAIGSGLCGHRVQVGKHAAGEAGHAGIAARRTRRHPRIRQQ